MNIKASFRKLVLRSAVIGGLALLFAVPEILWAQDSGWSEKTISDGMVVTGLVMDEYGQMFIGPVEITGTWEDEMFAWWTGRIAVDSYCGYDPYTSVWMPGPVFYTEAALEFQNQVIGGWIREFAGMPDYRRFFGNDGHLYERFQNYYAGGQVYTYYVDMTSGERSDSLTLADFLLANRQWISVITEQQRVQADFISTRAEELGQDYTYWENNAYITPEKVRVYGEVSMDLIELPDSILDSGEPSLLELIEEEIGVIEQSSDIIVESHSGTEGEV